MTESFGRIAILTIDKPATPSLVAPGKEFRDLRVAFDIEKNSESTPNTARIRIYNLAESSRSALQEKDTAVRLAVGYRGLEAILPGGKERALVADEDLANDATTVIFLGDSLDATVEREGPDVVTTVVAGDGYKALTEKHVHKTFAPGTSLYTVVNDVLQGLSLKAIGDVNDVPDDVFNSGLSVSGLASTQLDTLLASRGMEWFVQDGVANVIPMRSVTKEQSVKLSASTGLLTADKKKEGAIELKCLLNPKINPGRAIEVESITVTGKYRAQKVVHSGDTHGNEWQTKITAIPIVGELL